MIGWVHRNALCTCELVIWWFLELTANSGMPFSMCFQLLEDNAVDRGFKKKHSAVYRLMADSLAGLHGFCSMFLFAHFSCSVTVLRFILLSWLSLYLGLWFTQWLYHIMDLAHYRTFHYTNSKYIIKHSYPVSLPFFWSPLPARCESWGLWLNCRLPLHPPVLHPVPRHWSIAFNITSACHNWST